MLIKAAFDELKAKALIAKVHPKHRASIALLEEFRFCLYDSDSVDASTAHSWQKDHLIYRLSEDDYKTMPL